VRSMFEQVIQFLFMVKDPESRAEDYLDFAHFTKYLRLKPILEHPDWPIAQRLVNSPRRTESEPQIIAEFERVRPKFEYLDSNQKTRRHDFWFRLSLFDLAKKLDLDDEYVLIYTDCADWAHGNPSTTKSMPRWTSSSPVVFFKCSGYYALLILKMAELGGIKLSHEQLKSLEIMSTRWR